MVSTVIQARPQQFVKTAVLKPVIRRAFRYLASGCSLHLEGPTGIGKTTLAAYLAHGRKRPILWVMGGQDGCLRSDASGFEQAYREGWTLVYDEFNRSRPEENTVLLSVLEDRWGAGCHSYGQGQGLIHPEFRVILTSNAEEYCGTYGTQQALLDRVLTLRLPEPNILAQQQLLVELVGISREAAALVIGIVQQYFRQMGAESLSSLRPKLRIAQVCQRAGIGFAADNAEFRQVCRDVLLSRSSQSATDANEVLWELFNRLSKPMSVIERVPSRLHQAVN